MTSLFIPLEKLEAICGLSQFYLVLLSSCTFSHASVEKSLSICKLLFVTLQALQAPSLRFRNQCFLFIF